jgi:short-subunit dehydrogenase
MNLEGTRALVTGATGGLGQAIARALAGRGASVVLTGRRVDVLEPLAAELGGQAIAADLADPDAVDPLLAEAGAIDVLIANAAMAGAGRVLDDSVEQVDRALNVNLRAPIMLARALAPQMLERGRGHLVFVSSLQGKAPTPSSTMYVATKFGMRGFALALREDLAGTPVGVSVIYPGFIRDAGMFAESDTKLPFYVGTRTPKDVCDAVLSAIDRDRAEVSVAPFGVRAGSAFAGLMPAFAGAVQRRLGAQKIADQMTEGQRAKR